MPSIRTVTALMVVALARPVAAQHVAADSLRPGTPIRVQLATGGSVLSGAAVSWRVADPQAGQSSGLFRGSFQSWDSSGLHAIDSKSGMSWTFPSTAVTSVAAATGTDHSRGAILRGALMGAAVGALAVYYEDAGKYHTYSPFGAAHNVNRWMLGISAVGFAVGGAYRRLRPPKVWRPVERPEGSH